MKQVYGTYHRYGYQVWLNDPDSEYPELIYQAGNSPQESGYVTTDPDVMLPLKTIKAYCEQTCQEIAEEQDAEYTGMDYDLDAESECEKTIKE